jgi:hypothetical protein
MTVISVSEFSTLCILCLTVIRANGGEFLPRWRDDDGKVLATLSVPDPIRGPFPSWRPLALP